MLVSRSSSEWLTAGAAVFVACAAGGAALHSAAYTFPLVHGAVAIAVTYRWGQRMALAIWAAALASELLLHRPPLVALCAGGGLALGACLAAWLLNRYGFDRKFGRAKDIAIFVIASAVGMTAAGMIGLAAFAVMGSTSASPDVSRWLRWSIDTGAGALLIGPALLGLSHQSLERFVEQWAQASFWIVGVGICCAVIAFAPGPVGRSVVVMVAVLLVIVGAVRFGLVVSTVGAVTISCATALSLAFGFGMFGQFNEFTGRLTVLSFAATLTATSLIITVLLAERDAAALRTLQAERRYAHIFNGSPQAIWVHEPVTSSFLLVNAAAQRQYGWTLGEFLTMTVAELAAGGSRVLPFYLGHDTARETYAAPFETRHVTRDGSIIEVEVWVRSIDFGGRPAELVFAIDVSERRTLGKALIDALAGEQRRIAAEIHDGLGQELTGLALSLRALATRAERESVSISASLDELARLAARTIEGSKRVVQGLSPLSDAGGSLLSALDGLARRASLSGTEVSFRARGDSTVMLDAEALDHCYRIAQEAVQNALKHAAASRIEIEVRSDHSGLLLSITDDGCGLSSNTSSHRGLGMRTMRFRANAIGGTLVIESTKNGGTAVRCQAPQGQRPAGHNEDVSDVPAQRRLSNY